jgi:hypothetical protein
VKYFLLLFVLATSCSCDDSPQRNEARDKLTEKYKMTCTHRLNEDHYINRCENDEIICYFRNDHPFCKFRQP